MSHYNIWLDILKKGYENTIVFEDDIRFEPYFKEIVPVDEYLPIMFDKHPNVDWKGHYKHRNLKAFSVHPLYLFPTHYVGEPGHFSDTEDSKVITDQQENDANIVRIETKAEQNHFSD